MSNIILHMKKRMLTLPTFTLIFFSAILFSCEQNDVEKKVTIDLSAERTALLKADRAFSAISAQSGMNTAFLEYMDDDGILLRQGSLPLVGADAIDYLIRHNDSSFTLSWQPAHAFVAAAADIGYTYGTYAVKAKQIDTTLYGTYVSIWKKEKEGNWKYILHSEHKGINRTPALSQ